MNSFSRWCVLFVCLLVSLSVFARPIGDGTCPLAAPTIDGFIRDGEWDGAQTLAVTINLPDGGTAPARLYLINTAKTLYAALQVVRDRPAGDSQFDITLDANFDRMKSPGDDGCTVTHAQFGGDTTFDIVYYKGGECPDGWICSANDSAFGGANEVVGATGYDGTSMMYEIAKPLNSGDPNDIRTDFGATIGLQFHTRIFSIETGNFADTYFPGTPASGIYTDYTVRDCGFRQF